MSDKKELIKQDIAKNVSNYLAEKGIQEYSKEFFGDKIDNVLNKLNQLALSAESEDTQLKAIKEIRELLSDKKDSNQTNIQNNINLGDFLDSLK